MCFDQPVESLREYFERRAAALSDCADLVVESIGSVEVLSIEPHAEGALGVYLVPSGNDDLDQVGFSHEFDVPDEFADLPASVDALLDPAVDGRVRMLIGPRRGCVQIDEGDGFTTYGTRYGVGAWYPIPGWKRRAAVETFAPYRPA